GEQFMAALMTPVSLALYRMVIAESRRFPALGRQVFASGPEPVARHVAAYLRAEAPAGRLPGRDAGTAARGFLQMFKGDLHTRALFAIAPKPPAAEVRRVARIGARLFCDAVSPAPRPRARRTGGPTPN